MTSKEALKIIETYNYWNGAEEITGNTCVNPVYIETKKQYSEAKDILEKDLEMLEILKNTLTIDENYSSQDNGSTEAIKLCISNCVSVEEDEEYTDECYPNYDYYKIKEWIERC